MQQQFVYDIFFYFKYKLLFWKNCQMMDSNEIISSEEKFDGFSRVLIRTCQRNILLFKY